MIWWLRNRMRRLGYGLLLLTLGLLALLRQVAIWLAIGLHYLHTQLAEQGGVLTDTVGQHLATPAEDVEEPRRSPVPAVAVRTDEPAFTATRG